MISCRTPSQRSEEAPSDVARFGANESRYDFEYEDDDEEQEGDVGIENKYYNAKQMKEDSPEDAIDEFLGVPPLEEEKGDWFVEGSLPQGSLSK